MASLIKIKRTTSANLPSTLEQGELVYVYDTGAADNGAGGNGARLFIGDPTTNTNAPIEIAGEYFTNLLDHAHGTVTASSAIITNASNKIDQLNVDNLTLDGNTISSTNVNGDIVLDPAGTGKVDVSNARIQNVGAPSNNSDAATKEYVDNKSAAALLTINGDNSSTDTINLQDSDVTFVGGTGISADVTDNTVTVTLDSTNVTAGTYGSATEIPVFTVDAQGRIDSAGSVTVTHSFDLAGNTGTDTFNTGETLTITGSAPISTAVTNNQVAISAADATTSAKGVASFSSDNFSVSSGAVSIKNGGVANDELANSTITVNNATISLGDSATLTTSDIGEGTKLYYTDARARASVSIAPGQTGDGSLTYNSNTGVFTYTGPSASEVRAHFSPGTGVEITSGGEISIGQAVDSTSDVIFNDLQTTGNVTVQGDLTVQGTTTTINSVTLTTRDALIHLADSNNTTDAVDIGFVGHYYNSTNSRIEHTGFFRDASTGRYYLFTGLADSSLGLDSGTNVIDRGASSYTAGNLTVGDLYADTINAQLTGSYAGFDSDFNSQNTNNLPEGDSNRYYTRARVDSDFTDLLVAGTGITISHDPYEHTIEANIATASTPGIASFNTTNFGINVAGAVTTKDVTITTQDANTKTFTLGGGFSLLREANTGITTAVTGGNVVIGAAAASTAARGTAQFDSNQFSVTSGLATVIQIDGGTY